MTATDVQRIAALHGETLTGAEACTVAEAVNRYVRFNQEFIFERAEYINAPKEERLPITERELHDPKP